MKLATIFANECRPHAGFLSYSCHQLTPPGYFSLTSPMPATPQLKQLPDEALEHVAAYFRTLSEAMRLRILQLLSKGEMSVGEIAEALQSSNANVSRHLAQMALHGLVSREGRGTAVYYRIADPAVFELCELVCGSIAQRFEQTESHRKAFTAPKRKR